MNGIGRGIKLQACVWQAFRLVACRDTCKKERETSGRENLNDADRCNGSRRGETLGTTLVEVLRVRACSKFGNSTSDEDGGDENVTKQLVWMSSAMATRVRYTF